MTSTGLAASTTGGGGGGQTRKRRRGMTGSVETVIAQQPATTNITNKPSSSSSVPPAEPEDRIACLRRNATVMYDTLLNHAMQWGSLSLAWGPVETGVNRVMVGTKGDSVNTYAEEFNDEQTLYYSGRTDGTLEDDTWIGQPAELFVARVALPRPRTTRRMQLRFHETNKSNRVRMVKRMLHPGEVNRVRAMGSTHPHVVVTHTDEQTVFLWNTQTQPHRVMPDDNPYAPGSKKKRPERYKCSIPDATLIGHTSGLKYALETSRTRIISGSTNGTVLCWDVGNNIVDRQVSPLAMFQDGHSGSVEDCCFCPDDENIVCSVSQDRSILIWDARAVREPVNAVVNAHMDDINCCSWSPSDATKILTGGSDSVANIFDLRRLNTGPLYQVPHSASIVNVRWSPHSPHFFITSDEASSVTIYSTSSNAGATTSSTSSDGPRVIFQHLGHRSPAVDLSWNTFGTCPEDIVIASVSDDSQDEAKGGGGTLQVWRVSEYATRNAKMDAKWMTEVEDALVPNSGAVGEESDSDQGGGGGGTGGGGTGD